MRRMIAKTTWATRTLASPIRSVRLQLICVCALKTAPRLLAVPGETVPPARPTLVLVTGVLLQQVMIVPRTRPTFAPVAALAIMPAAKAVCPMRVSVSMAKSLKEVHVRLMGPPVAPHAR